MFTASSSGLTAGVNQASASMKRLERDVRGLRGGLSTLTAISGAQLFGQIASGAVSAARSFLSMASASMDAIGNQRDLAARLGVTYGELSGLTLAGEQVGVSMETIGAAVTRAEVAFTKAASGSSTAISAFKRIGLSVEQLNGLSTADRFKAIAQAISELPTPAERSAAAVGLFGRAGAQLLPLFEQGAAGIQAATVEANALGLTLNSVQADNVDAMGDSFTKAQAAVRGVVDQVVAYLAPAVTRVTEAFTQLVSGIGGQNIGAAIGEAILGAARYLAQVADFFIANTSPIFEYLSEVGAQWSAVWEVGARVGAFLAGVARTFEAGFRSFAAIITGAFGLVFRGLGDFAQNIPGFGAVGEQLSAAGESLTQSSAQMFGQASDALDAAGQNFERALFGRAENAGDAIAGPVTAAFDAGAQAARDALGKVDVAQAQTVEVQQTVQVAGIREAIQGIDARTSEGMKEYFRILRGDGSGGVQERIADAAERTADAAEDWSVELDVFDLAAAAGS